jgi:hypothetical protein
MEIIILITIKGIQQHRIYTHKIEDKLLSIKVIYHHHHHHAHCIPAADDDNIDDNINENLANIKTINKEQNNS